MGLSGSKARSVWLSGWQEAADGGENVPRLDVVDHARDAGDQEPVPRQQQVRVVDGLRIGPDDVVEAETEGRGDGGQGVPRWTVYMKQAGCRVVVGAGVASGAGCSVGWSGCTCLTATPEGAVATTGGFGLWTTPPMRQASRFTARWRPGPWGYAGGVGPDSPWFTDEPPAGPSFWYYRVLALGAGACYSAPSNVVVASGH